MYIHPGEARFQVHLSKKHLITNIYSSCYAFCTPSDIFDRCISPTRLHMLVNMYHQTLTGIHIHCFFLTPAPLGGGGRGGGDEERALLYKTTDSFGCFNNCHCCYYYYFCSSTLRSSVCEVGGGCISRHSGTGALALYVSEVPLKLPYPANDRRTR